MATAKDVADIIGSLAAALAVLVGGAWTYFKFIRARTLRPRLAVALNGEWLRIGRSDALRARIAVTNIGGTDVRIRQGGSGLRISTVTRSRRTTPALVSWERLCTYTVLKEHQWIEPGEAISDELLLHVGRRQALLFEARLVVSFGIRGRTIELFARHVLPEHELPVRDE